MNTEPINPAEQAASTIEIQSPDGVKNVAIPASWTIHETAKVAEILEAAGYVYAKPRTSSAVLAFKPRPWVVPTGE